MNADNSDVFTVFVMTSNASAETNTSRDFESFSPTSNLQFNVTTISNVRGHVTYFSTRPAEKILCYILSAVSLYLSIATVLYHVKFAKEDKPKRTRGFCNFSPAWWTNNLCTLSAVTLLLQSSWYAIDIFGKDLTKDVCTVYVVMGSAWDFINRFSVYLVLWIRQYQIYQAPTFKEMYTLPTKVANWGTLTGLIFLNLIHCICMSTTPAHSNDKGCVVPPISDIVFLSIRVTFGLFTFCKVCLLLLMVRPLFRRIKVKTITNTKCKELIIRLTVCTIVTTVTDTLVLVVSAIPVPDQSSTYIPIVSGLNSVINVVVLFFSFDDVKKRLLPVAATCHCFPKTPLLTNLAKVDQVATITK